MATSFGKVVLDLVTWTSTSTIICIAVCICCTIEETVRKVVFSHTKAKDTDVGRENSTAVVGLTFPFPFHARRGLGHHVRLRDLEEFMSNQGRAQQMKNLPRGGAPRPRGPAPLT